MSEPDWESLANLQFLIYNRVTDSLNAALSSLALSDMPEARNLPPGFWKKRATDKIVSVLNLFTAWTYLLRYKQGEPIPARALRPFRANSLLGWISVQLQLSPAPRLHQNPLLHGNQDTLQEALLLLYSAALTQGTNVRVTVEATDQGAWFRVQFARPTPLPTPLSALIASFSGHWREQNVALELANARDFIRLNSYELLLNSAPGQSEFAFFVQRARATRPPEAAPSEQAESAGETVALESDETPILTDLLPPIPSQDEATPKAPPLAVLRPLPPVSRVESPISPPLPPTPDPVQPESTALPKDNSVTIVSSSTPLMRTVLSASEPAAPPPTPPAAPDQPAESVEAAVPDETRPIILPAESAAPNRHAPANDLAPRQTSEPKPPSAPESGKPGEADKDAAATPPDSGSRTSP
ncbi:MAG: hypothetical protein GXY36_13015 [Chloroflexi bacterium]|nr:hypothetical protein [Chloroflexota bacterium]